MKSLRQHQRFHVRQHGQSDCGVACLLAVIRYYGGNTTIENLRQHSGTDKEGTSLYGLYEAANRSGFTAEGCEADPAALIAHEQPVILHVLMDGKRQHYVVCYGYEKGCFLIGDPAMPQLMHWSVSQLEQAWPSHKCLTLVPNEAFETTQTQQTAQKTWLWGLLQEDVPLLAMGTCLGVLVTLLGMAMTIFSQRLIDDILPKHDAKRLSLGLGLVIILLLARVGISALRSFFLLRQSQDFNNRIGFRFYETLLRLPKSFFDTRKIGELVARLHDTRRIQSVISQLVGSSFIEVLGVVISLCFLFAYHWQTGLVLLVCLPLYGFWIFRFNRPIFNIQREVMVAYAQSESQYISSMQGIAEIKNFNKEDYFGEINRSIYGALQEKVFLLGKWQVRLSVIVGIIEALFMGGMLAFTSWQVYQNQLKLGEMMAVVGIGSSLLPNVTRLALLSIPLNEAKVAFQRMFEFVSIPPEANILAETVLVQRFESLRFQDVSFRFSGRKRLLHQINFEISSGELIGIIGESGGGKSTLCQLIEKFYEPESGEIWVNSTISFSRILPAIWRAKVGVVPQQIHLFNGTVLENICLDNKQEETKKVADFLQEYGFMPFINTLPKGLFTIIAEDGVHLSGGQKQLLALARALYKKPSLLVLDEATASLDPQTEQVVLNLLERLKVEGTAIIFISHRAQSLQPISNQLFQLKEGRLSLLRTTFEPA